MIVRASDRLTTFPSRGVPASTHRPGLLGRSVHAIDNLVARLGSVGFVTHASVNLLTHHGIQPCRLVEGAANSSVLSRGDLFVDGFAVVFYFRGSDVAAGGQCVAGGGDFVEGG